MPTKIGSDGAIRIYDPKTNTFGSYRPDGFTRTLYKPDPAKHGFITNEAYWDAQQGVYGRHKEYALPCLWL